MINPIRVVKDEVVKAHETAKGRHSREEDTLDRWYRWKVIAATISEIAKSFALTIASLSAGMLGLVAGYYEVKKVFKANHKPKDIQTESSRVLVHPKKNTSAKVKLRDSQQELQGVVVQMSSPDIYKMDSNTVTLGASIVVFIAVQAYNMIKKKSQ